MKAGLIRLWPDDGLARGGYPLHWRHDVGFGLCSPANLYPFTNQTVLGLRLIAPRQRADSDELMTLKPLERCSSPLMGIFRVWPKSERERMHEKRPPSAFLRSVVTPSGSPRTDRSREALATPKRRQRLGSFKSVAFVSMALARVKRAYPMNSALTGRVILIAEDEPLIAFEIAQAFEAEGARVMSHSQSRRRPGWG